MVRVRRTREVVEEPPTRQRRVRSRVMVEEQQELDLVESEEDDEGLDMSDTPDAPREGETEFEAADRIEDKYRKRAKSPLKAIRAFCVICVGCYPREVAKCTAPKCVLFPFRFGRNPFQKRG